MKNGTICLPMAPFVVLVGVAGFEPTASSSRTKRATGLRYTPMRPVMWVQKYHFCLKKAKT